MPNKKLKTFLNLKPFRDGGSGGEYRAIGSTLHGTRNGSEWLSALVC